MAIRAGFLALLAAMAFLAASGGAHAHVDGPSLDTSCAVCAAHSQAKAICPDGVGVLATGPAPSLPLAHPSLLSGDARPTGAAAPRGPPAAV
jgi:hypothetical protein